MPAAAAQWHVLRHTRIVAKHPEVRSLQGTYPLSQLFIVGLVAVDVALAWAVHQSSWLTVLAVAVGVGAFVAHALGVLIHEATHNLVARGTRANKLWMLVANLPLLAPAAIEFRAQHLLHHKFLGEVDGRDTQAPTRAEIAFVGASSLRKLASFSLGRFFYRARPANHVPRDRFLWLNWGAQLVATIGLFGLVSAKGLFFLGIGGLLAFGPHPLGARRLSEHFAMRADQPSVSYYGILNRVTFDVGYHVEHHDFPAIPWPRLRTLRKVAREEYDSLFAFQSWTRLLLAHWFDPRYRVEHYVGFGTALEGGAQDAPASEFSSPPGQPTLAKPAARTESKFLPHSFV
ncbi:MAG: fatty acid desaturase [Myxococcaceae bacterium]